MDDSNGYEHTSGDERDSGMSISFSLSVGYRRRRPNVMGDRLEQRIDSFGLMFIGGIIGIAIIVYVLPQIVQWLTHLGQ